MSEININNAKIGVLLHRKQVQMEFMNIKNTQLPFQVKNIYNASILTNYLIVNDSSSNYPVVINGKAQAFIYSKVSFGHIVYSGFAAPSSQFGAEKKITKKSCGTGSFEAHIYELDRTNLNFVFINDTDVIEIPYQSGFRVQVPLYHSR